MNKEIKVILPGGAGLVGQNLVARLLAKGYSNIVVIDKHSSNLNILSKIQPSVKCILADVSETGSWTEYFNDADVVVMLQAQIGGIFIEEFVTNNETSTEIILSLIKDKKIPQLIHISSSVVESVADDFYTNSKKVQEKMVIESGIPCPILRPTLMFGWFDRKHLGWLSRFMQKMPIFPIPGDGKYMRQPLYCGDFCNVIISCIENNIQSGIFNISGHEKIDYIDMIRMIKKVVKAKAIILKIPYALFYSLLWIWSKFDKNPPFTTQQLAALTAKDEFEVTDWPSIFGVKYTTFEDALNETFNDSRYSSITLEF
jgi:nucleoside-diphosphate-sugar epimerase